MKSEKKPVCIVGLQKEVEARHIRTVGIKKYHNYPSYKTNEDHSNFQRMLLHREDLFNFSPILLKMDSVKDRNLYHKKDQSKITVKEGIYTYFVGEGNNSELMEKIMQRRLNWSSTSTLTIKCSLFSFQF